MLTLAYERNEVKYVWLNELDSVFSKKDSLVEFSYVDPSFWESLNVKTIIQGLMSYE